MACSKAKHFHVICRDVFEQENFEKVLEVADANSALDRTILELPDSWEASIEVRDDSPLSGGNFR